ncbi:hypothetical protein GQ55_7G033600 [Panicum hallii var. hallii]|uniref:Uncharacterized protein n=1 Tax=Panicum hallii var. hallii TaxID=1504633 RepID=A0A2T7CS92_9POAL|nr:hypothetical protein GQ55_7G033600 [Panicum hallii var. hallii]
MADGDDPMSHNYELRAMGLREDDEDDLATDAEELFGSNAAVDLNVNIQGLPQGQAEFESVSTGTASGSGTSRKRRASTSKIWKDFEEIYEVIDGNAKEDYLSVVAHYVNVDW